MIKVDNKKTIDRLTGKNFKSNRKRNAMIILAIILTTFMLTTVFSIGISYITSINERTIKMNGIDSDAVLYAATDEQLSKVSTIDNVKTAGLYAGTGMITKHNGIPAEISLRWADETAWKTMIIPAAMEYTKGSYPQNDDEIMLSEKGLETLGIDNPKIGMKIKTEYFTQVDDGEKNWTLTGYYKDYTNNATGYVSKEFHKASEVVPSLYIKFDSPIIDQEYIDELTKELELTDDQYLQAGTELAGMYKFAIMGICGLSLLIAVSGYLLIYNLVYISITRDVRYYGLLKTVGITSKQINRILKKQILWLSLIGIPLGLLLGAAVSLLVVPSIVDAVSFMGGDVSFNPIIFIGAAFFSLITIIISVSKPIKIAKNISPVEASKYITIKTNKEKKQGIRGGKIVRMAWSNVFRDKKRVIVVFLSLIVGLSSFLASSAIIKSNGADNVLNTILNYDYEILNKSMVNSFDNKNPKQLVTDKMISDINDLEGVQSTHLFTGDIVEIPYHKQFEKYFKFSYDEYMVGESYDEGRKRIEESPEDFTGYLVGIDEYTFDQYNNNTEHPVDREKFLNGEIALIATPNDNSAETLKDVPGQKIKFRLPDGISTDFQSIEIAGLINDPNIGVQYSGFWNNIVVSDKYAEQMTEDPMIDHLDVVYKEPYDKKTEKEVKAIQGKNKLLKHESKIERHKDMKETENQLTIFGGGIALILALLGLINYINMIATGIQNRKNELAMLQGIGMTSKQQRKMLTLEGLFYGTISIILACITGSAVGYFLFESLNMYQVEYIVPITVNLIFFLIILATCIAVPPLVYKFMNKGSIIEQLRNIE